MSVAARTQRPLGAFDAAIGRDLHVELYTVVTRTCLLAGRGLPEQRTSLGYCGMPRSADG